MTGEPISFRHRRRKTVQQALTPGLGGLSGRGCRGTSSVPPVGVEHTDIGRRKVLKQALGKVESTPYERSTTANARHISEYY